MTNAKLPSMRIFPGLVFIATVCWSCGQVHAQASQAVAPSTTPLAVLVEGQRIDADIHPNGQLLRYAPIFNALRIRHAYDPALRTLRVARPYDNATIELVFPDGLVRANGQAIGRIPGGELEEPQDGWLSPNAISVLSGAVAKLEGTNWKFDLDPRLRPDTNLELWIADKRVATPVAPRTAGNILLIPLRPIADAVGARIVVEGQTISVTRLQDGLVISWNTQTGLIIGNRRPLGVVAPSALTELASLLLPKDAVAALTGTNIVLAPGSNRIDVNLDDRLTGVITPSSKVIERARKAPFAVQQTRFQATTTGFNTVESRAQMGVYNGQLRFEAPADGRILGDLDPNPQRVTNPLRPTWLSLAWQSLEGPSGLFGDAVAARRELDGVGVSRLRGVAYQVTTAEGQLRAIAGAPIGSSTSTAPPAGGKTPAVGYPSFSGSAAGLRWYSLDGKSEVGLSVKSGGVGAGGSQSVLSWNETTRWGDARKAADGKGSAWTLYSDSHVGVVKRDDPSLGGGGGRSYLALSGQLPGYWNLGTSAQYFSASFNGDPSLQTNGVYKDPVDQGGVDVSLSGPLTRWLSVGSRAFGRRTGVIGTLQSSSVGGGGNLSIAIPSAEAVVALDYSTVTAKSFPTATSSVDAGIGAVAPVTTALQKTDVDRITLTLDKRLSVANLSARFETTESRGVLRQRARALTTTLSFNPWTWVGARGQTLSVSGAVLGNWSRGSTPFGDTRSAGHTWSANMALQSGELLGERWRMSTNFGVSGSTSSIGTNSRGNAEANLNNLLSGLPLINTSNQTNSSTGWYLSARSQHLLSRHFTLEWGANKAQGQSSFAYLVLNGLFAGVPPRANLLPRPRHGLVQGRVFLDRNANGTQEPDERGMPGVLVRLGGTPWSLRTDANGNFTINNVPQGPYTVVVDVSSLPLGYRVETGSAPRISVLDQEMTEVNIAIAESGQLRGRLFFDSNGNGSAESDESGPVGRTIRLTDANGATVETQTAVFGQYVFDALALGRYQLIVAGQSYVVEISASKRFATRDIAVKP
jgi:hypothetical protein